MLYSPAIKSRNFEPRSYIEEVKSFDSSNFHIANREGDIGRLLRMVAYSPKPNFAIIGETGNGKTMTLEFILDVITGKRTLPQNHEWCDLFDTIKKKIKEFQARDYLFLPNLQDPSRPVVLDFVNGEIVRAEKMATSFCDEIVKFVEPLGTHEKIYPYFTPNEFKKHVSLSVKKIYEKLYRKLAIIAEDYHADFDIKPSRNFQSYEFSYTFLESRVNWAAIQRGMGVPLGRRKKNKRVHNKKMRPSDIKRRLSERLRNSIRGDITRLFSLVDEIQVPNYSLEQKRKILTEVMAKTDVEYHAISQEYKRGIIPYYRALTKAKVFEKMDLYISQESLDWCIAQFADIASVHKKDAPSSLKEWMDAVVRYFDQNRDVFSNALTELYLEASGGSLRQRKRQEKGTPAHPFIEEEFASGMFRLPHGKRTMELYRILAPSACRLAGSGEMSIRYPKSFLDEDMLGKIEKPCYTKNDDDDDEYSDDDDHDSKKPPHLCFTPGYLMEASILVLVDNMQGFFKAMLGSEEQEAAARRQTILTFVEYGDLIIEKYGITYKIHSPTMIIGCDNENPFVKNHSYLTDRYDNDEAMARRFVVYDWSNITQNIAKTRKGTIGVIKQAVDNFNKEYQSSLSLSPEVIDCLLVDFSTADLMRLDYSALVDTTNNLLSFGRLKCDDRTLLLEDLVEYNKEKEPKERFVFVNERFDRMIGTLPEKAIGEVYGVALIDAAGDLFPIRSGVILELAKDATTNFVHHDTVSGAYSPRGMNTAVTNKGFFEAVDFMKRYINDPVRFICKTTFHREYGADGDSASLAIFVSLHSAISEIPVYANTVYTGNVSFVDGSVGPIGGIYQKALMVWQAQQRLKQSGDKRTMRFVFPAENYLDLKHEVRVSPYPVAQDIDLIPITHVNEALYVGMNSFNTSIKLLPQKINTKAKEFLTKIRKNTQHLNKKVLTAYNGHA